ncbi:MAG: cell division topological specificity factor MinE [Calditrichaeota bacterium]|nr:MAG: cell division topological specificity factor MinE [Calditrichota bacterium]
MAWVANFMKKESSKESAKSRLKLVLTHDRASISPGVLQMIKKDILGVIKKYVEVDGRRMQVNITEDASKVELVANIPIKNARQREL